MLNSLGLACVISIEDLDKLLLHKQKAQAFEKNEIVMATGIFKGEWEEVTFPKSPWNVWQRTELLPL